MPGQGNWHLFQVLLPLEQLRQSRAQIMQQLKEHNIGTGVHYPAIHLFKLYRAQGFTSGMLPIAEQVGQRSLSLPLFPAMQDSDIDRVVNAIDAIFRAAHCSS